MPSLDKIAHGEQCYSNVTYISKSIGLKSKLILKKKTVCIYQALMCSLYIIKTDQCCIHFSSQVPVI